MNYIRDDMEKKYSDEIKKLVETIDLADFNSQEFYNTLNSAGLSKNLEIIKGVFELQLQHGWACYISKILLGTPKIISCLYALPWKDGKNETVDLVVNGKLCTGKSISPEERKQLNEIMEKERNIPLDDKLKFLISSVLGFAPEDLTPDMKLVDDLFLEYPEDFDELIMEVEYEFDCVIDQLTLMKAKTLREMIEYLKSVIK